jgi:K(+)-stimulated pyrophosphate-energized sodium pump
MLPGAIAIVSPLIIGFLLGPEALGGFLAGATVSGVLMGMFQNNAGGAWDNAKKSFEKGVEINGEMYYKKSEPHKASVTGDTVGDPFKDTSGPSMNILIKLMSIVSLVIAPTLAQLHGASADHMVEKRIEIKATNGGETANITVNTTDENLDQLIAAMNKAGLTTPDNVSLEIKNGKIIVDGKELSEDVAKQFSMYLDGKKDLNIKVNVKKDKK